jgi:hypothetical protein
MSDNKVVSHEEWLKARLGLLAAEKEFTRQRDALTRRRMAMPWERVEKSYQFEGPNGALSLADLFDGRSHSQWDRSCKQRTTGRADRTRGREETSHVLQLIDPAIRLLR